MVTARPLKETVENTELLGEAFIGPQHYFKERDLIWIEGRGKERGNMFYKCDILEIRKNLTTPEQPLLWDSEFIKTTSSSGQA